MPREDRDTILLIHGDDAMASKIDKFLRAMRYDVVRCKRGMDGVQIVFQLRPDVVLVDQTLPDTHGALVCEMMKASAPNHALPIVLLASAQEMAALRRSKQRLMADTVLRKPFEPMALYNVIVSLQRAREEAASRPKPPVPGVTPPRAAGPPKTKPSTPSSFELTGSLARLPVPRILHHLLRGRMSGLLALSRPDATIEVHFATGKPDRLRSSYIRELALGTILVEAGRLSARQRETLWKTAASSGKKLGTVLIEAGLLRAEELEPLLLAQSREKLLATFDERWREAGYSFHTDRDAAEAVPVQTEPGALIVEGIRRFYSPDRVATFFARKERMHAPLVRNEHHPYNLARLGLSAWETGILAAVRAGRTPAQIVASVGGEASRVLNFLYALVVMDIVVPTEGPGERERGRPMQ